MPRTTVRPHVLHNPLLVGNGRWCSCCFPDGPPASFGWGQYRRGCNECAGAGRIVFTAEEIVARTVAEARAARERSA